LGRADVAHYRLAMIDPKAELELGLSFRAPPLI
jgi:hypothetical protein